MEIYNYHPTTKEFMGKETPREDPLESKNQGRPIYLLPANSTFIECPNPQKNFKWCFNEEKNSWFRVPDFRGTKVYSTYDASELVISELGPLPNGYTNEVPLVEFPKWNGKTWVEDTDNKAIVEKEQAVRRLAETDRSMARAAEDLISVLVDKGVIAASDLPTALLTKIQNRQALREEISKY